MRRSGDQVIGKDNKIGAGRTTSGRIILEEERNDQAFLRDLAECCEVTGSAIRAEPDSIQSAFAQLNKSYTGFASFVLRKFKSIDLPKEAVAMLADLLGTELVDTADIDSLLKRLHDSGNHERFIEAYGQFSSQAGHNHNFKRMLAKAYISSGRIEPALKAFEGYVRSEISASRSKKRKTKWSMKRVLDPIDDMTSGRDDLLETRVAMFDVVLQQAEKGMSSSSTEDITRAVKDEYYKAARLLAKGKRFDKALEVFSTYAAMEFSTFVHECKSGKRQKATFISDISHLFNDRLVNLNLHEGEPYTEECHDLRVKAIACVEQKLQVALKQLGIDSKQGLSSIPVDFSLCDVFDHYYSEGKFKTALGIADVETFKKAVWGMGNYGELIFRVAYACYKTGKLEDLLKLKYEERPKEKGAAETGDYSEYHRANAALIAIAESITGIVPRKQARQTLRSFRSWKPSDERFVEIRQAALHNISFLNVLSEDISKGFNGLRRKIFNKSLLYSSLNRLGRSMKRNLVYMALGSAGTLGYLYYEQEIQELLAGSEEVIVETVQDSKQESAPIIIPEEDKDVKQIVIKEPSVVRGQLPRSSNPEGSAVLNNEEISALVEAGFQAYAAAKVRKQAGALRDRGFSSAAESLKKVVDAGFFENTRVFPVLLASLNESRDFRDSMDYFAKISPHLKDDDDSVWAMSCAAEAHRFKGNICEALDLGQSAYHKQPDNSHYKGLFQEYIQIYKKKKLSYRCDREKSGKPMNCVFNACEKQDIKTHAESSGKTELVYHQENAKKFSKQNQERGVRLYEQNKDWRAIPLFEKAVEQDPFNLEAQWYLIESVHNTDETVRWTAEKKSAKIRKHFQEIPESILLKDKNGLSALIYLRAAYAYSGHDVCCAIYCIDKAEEAYEKLEDPEFDLGDTEEFREKAGTRLGSHDSCKCGTKTVRVR